MFPRFMPLPIARITSSDVIVFASSVSVDADELSEVPPPGVVSLGALPPEQPVRVIIDDKTAAMPVLSIAIDSIDDLPPCGHNKNAMSKSITNVFYHKVDLISSTMWTDFIKNA